MFLISMNCRADQRDELRSNDVVLNVVAKHSKEHIAEHVGV